MISVTRPSRSTRMKALGSKVEGGGAGRSKPSSSPPPPAALTLRNSRRDTPGWRTTSACRRSFDGGADAPIGAAATDVPRHRGVDIGVGRMRLGREQRRGGHDLTRLAVAALHDLHVEPRLLDAFAARRLSHGLDGRDALPGHRGTGGGGGEGGAPRPRAPVAAPAAAPRPWCGLLPPPPRPTGGCSEGSPPPPPSPPPVPAVTG